MEFEKIEPGQLFTIGNTPSYPKLRTSRGYVDIRDEIVKHCEVLPVSWTIDLMTKEDVARRLDVTLEDLNRWVNRWI